MSDLRQVDTSRRTLRVLVVDDDPGVRRLLATALELDGHTVETAADGVDALRVTPVFDPDVIVLDIMMPVLDGLTTLGRLPRVGGRPAVVMLSARTGDLDRRAARALGAADYVPKPFDVGELVDRVVAVAP